MATASPAKMKVADLRAALAERGMSTAGLKAEVKTAAGMKSVPPDFEQIAKACLSLTSDAKKKDAGGWNLFAKEVKSELVTNSKLVKIVDKCLT